MVAKLANHSDGITLMDNRLQGKCGRQLRSRCFKKLHWD